MVQGSWKLQKVIFSSLQSTGIDSLVTYSKGGFLFKSGKADYRNEVSYNLGTSSPIFATYIAEGENSVFFNEPCCNVDWSQVYFMPRGSFVATFADNGGLVLTGQAYFTNQPGRPGRNVIIFLQKGSFGQ